MCERAESREPTKSQSRMSVPRRKCGSSDLELGVIGIGGWSFGGGEYWGEQDQKDISRSCTIYYSLA
jgi:hypothetical protein